MSFINGILGFILSTFNVPVKQNNPLIIRQTPMIDLVVYSFNRPMQLYAFLESAEYYIRGITQVYVIYRASNHSYEQAYQIVHNRFPAIHFIKQSSKPLQDFKSLTLEYIFKLPHEYIILAVDDIIIKNTIDLQECARALEQYNAYGFYLSLGKNLTYCYSIGKPQKLPPFKDKNGIYSWYFHEGEYDWEYPNSLDMTLYRKSDLEYLLCYLEYTTPNTLEYALAVNADMSQKGLCYEYSKVLNIPLNIVQTDFANTHTNSFNTEQLLDLFNQGFKIDIKQFHCFANVARHIDNIDLIKFIERNNMGTNNENNKEHSHTNSCR